MDPVFLTIEEVTDIHADQIAQYGGSSGIRASIGLPDVYPALTAALEVL